MENFDLSLFRSDAFRGDSPPTEWLVEGRLPRGRVVVFAAQGGVGKSWALCELFTAINDGGASHVWGGRVVEAGLPCMILAAEDSFSEVDNRLRTIRGAFNCKPAPHGYIVPAGDVGGMTLFKRDFDGSIVATEAYAWLDIQIEAMRAEFGKIGFVAVDTLSALAHFNENDNGEASQVMQGLVRLATKHDTTVIVAHHYAKGGDTGKGQNAVRGASALVNSARLALGLERLDRAEEQAALEAAGAADGRAVRMSVLKSNLNVDSRPVTLAWPKGSAMIDVSDLIGDASSEGALLRIIRELVERGERVCKSGKGGLYSRKSSDWPKCLQVGRDRLEGVVQSLIDRGLIVVENSFLTVPESVECRS